MSKECELCHYWYFKDINFKYEKYLCNGCHGLMQKAISFNNVAIVYVKGNAYRINFWHMSKHGPINVMNGSNLDDKRGVLLKKKLLYIKMSHCNSIESTDLTY